MKVTVYSYLLSKNELTSGSHACVQASESGDPNVVSGSYRVALPDGRLQVVTYEVHPSDGYRAQVRYEGAARYPDPPLQPSARSSRLSDQVKFKRQLRKTDLLAAAGTSVVSPDRNPAPSFPAVDNIRQAKKLGSKVTSPAANLRRFVVSDLTAEPSQLDVFTPSPSPSSGPERRLLITGGDVDTEPVPEPTPDDLLLPNTKATVSWPQGPPQKPGRREDWQDNCPDPSSCRAAEAAAVSGKKWQVQFAEATTEVSYTWPTFTSTLRTAETPAVELFDEVYATEAAAARPSQASSSQPRPSQASSSQPRPTEPPVPLFYPRLVEENNSSAQQRTGPSAAPIVVVQESIQQPQPSYYQPVLYRSEVLGHRFQPLSWTEVRSELSTPAPVASSGIRVVPAAAAAAFGEKNNKVPVAAAPLGSYSGIVATGFGAAPANNVNPIVSPAVPAFGTENRIYPAAAPAYGTENRISSAVAAAYGTDNRISPAAAAAYGTETRISSAAAGGQNRIFPAAAVVFKTENRIIPAAATSFGRDSRIAAAGQAVSNYDNRIIYLPQLVSRFPGANLPIKNTAAVQYQNVETSLSPAAANQEPAAQLVNFETVHPYEFPIRRPLSPDQPRLATADNDQRTAANGVEGEYLKNYAGYLFDSRLSSQPNQNNLQQEVAKRSQLLPNGPQPSPGAAKGLQVSPDTHRLPRLSSENPKGWQLSSQALTGTQLQLQRGWAQSDVGAETTSGNAAVQQLSTDQQQQDQLTAAIEQLYTTAVDISTTTTSPSQTLLEDRTATAATATWWPTIEETYTSAAATSSVSTTPTTAATTTTTAATTEAMRPVHSSDRVRLIYRGEKFVPEFSLVHV